MYYRKTKTKGLPALSWLGRKRGGIWKEQMVAKSYWKEQSSETRFQIPTVCRWVQKEFERQNDHLGL